jgi:glucans biosynthesis protein
LIALAQDVAQRPWQPPDEKSLSGEDRINYDEYRGIEYRPEHAEWRTVPGTFQLHLYHCGYLFPQPVTINLVEGQNVRPVSFRSDLFSFGSAEVARKARATPGFAGFCVYVPDREGGSREVLSFLGASYLRGAPLDGHYGTSARGLAVNTGSPGPEEFPEFRAFWLERPSQGSCSLRLYALLDSPSVSGAYQFDCRVSEETAIEVRVHLFFRNAVERIGLAPLTSEFFHGEYQRPRQPDPKDRPEVHDCDGLLIATGDGEWIWRPIGSPAVSQLDSYAATSLRGFGLMQRDRNPRHYADRIATELRSNVWVEPLEGFGSGSVQLYRFPTDSEWLDNISAFWNPSQPPQPGQEWFVHYVLHFSLRGPPEQRGATVVNTVRNPKSANLTQYVIDFTGIPSPSPACEIEGVVAVSAGNATSIRVTPENDGSILRLSFDASRPTNATVTLRAFLRSGKDTLSETWTDTWEE